MHHAYTQTIARRKIPFVGRGESRGIPPICVICQNRRIEIAVRVESFATGGKPVRFLRVRNSRRAVHSGETSPARVKPPVPSWRDVFLCGDFDKTPQVPPVFGGETLR